jgi:hypothetical protein
MPMPRLSRYAFGAAGNSQAIGANLAVISTPGVGRWRVWGTVRHTLADGVRLVLGSTTLLVITNAAAGTSDFGPIIIDITNRNDDLFLELELATGAADTASANLYAEYLERSS